MKRGEWGEKNGREENRERRMERDDDILFQAVENAGCVISVKLF